MGPRANMTLFKAAFFSFILLGLLTILLYFGEFPLLAVIGCFILCWAGLLYKVTHGFHLIWFSLTKKASSRMTEATPLLTTNSDLEAQSSLGNSAERTPNFRRSSPLPIPCRRSDQYNDELLPARSWMDSLPWMASSLVSRYLEWKQKQVAHERRNTLSESVAVSQMNETQRGTARHHTQSESAVRRFEN